MAKRSASGLARAVRKLKAEQLALTDWELLRLFAEGGDQAAFAALVSRHSAMVLGVCKRVLPTEQDAEDACQAVFLILAKKARSVRWQTSVANWMYTTARKVARNARLAASRRARREGTAAVLRREEDSSSSLRPPADTMSSRELIAALDEELDRLSPRYREPLVLCYLEGLTRDEAASQLGVPKATLKSQLERGRKKLADALTARGCTLGVTLLATAATSAAGASLPQVEEMILASAGGSPPPAVAALAREVAMSGMTTRSKTALLALLGIATLGVAYAAWPSDPPGRAAKEKAPAVAQNEPPKEVEGETVFTYAGRVLSPEGKPLKGAKVHICGLNRGTIEFVEKCRSDAEGNFRFRVRREEFHGREDREPGRYVWIGATAAGCGPAVQGAAQAKDREKLTLWLAPEQIVTDRVVDLQGKPIAGVSVSAYIRYARQAADHRLIAFDAPEQQGEISSNVMPYDPDLPNAVTDREGRCVLRGLGKGWLHHLFISGPTIVRTQAELVTRPEKPQRVPGAGLWNGRNPPRVIRYGSDFVHVAEPSKPLVGEVRDRVSGRPIPNVRVGKAWVRDGEAWGWTETDKDGRFRLDGLPSGRHQLTVEASPPYVPSQYEAAADQPGTEPFRCTIELQPYVFVRGRVTDRTTGKPVKGQVEYCPFANNPELKNAPLLAQTRGIRPTAITAQLDPEGRYSLPALPGPGLILVKAEGAYRRAVVAEADRRAGLLHQLDPELFDTRPMPTWAAESHAYRLLDVPKGKTAEYELTVDPGRSLPLPVLDPDGKPVEARALGLMPEPGDHTQELKSGRGTIAALAPGERRKVYVRATGRALAAGVTVSGDDKGPITLRLRPTGVLTGRLLDADGRPLVGESLQVAYDSNATSGGVLHASSYMGRLLSAPEEARQRRLRGYPDKRPNVGAEKTDADGRFRIEGVIPEVSLVVKVQLTRPSTDRKDKGARLIVGMAPVVGATTVEPGQTKDLGTISVSSGKRK